MSAANNGLIAVWLDVPPGREEEFNELTDRDAFESPEGLKARKTPWTEKMRSLFQNTRRSMCKLILPSVHSGQNR